MRTTSILGVLAVIACVASCNFDKIVIKTRRDSKVYNFFPLECSTTDFLVKATNDIHIAFTQMPTFSPPFYEVVFGGWSNTKSVIRKDNDEIQAEALGCHVQKNQFARYWAHIDNDEQTISVGLDKNSRPLMVFNDTNFMKMKYFGISTGFGSEGEWHLSTDNICCNKTNKIDGKQEEVVTTVGPDSNAIV